MKKVLITTVPFAKKNSLPLELLADSGVDYLINPLGRRLREEELAEMVSDFDVIIAGTEPITEFVMKKGRNLGLISRVGIGLDSVDLLAAKRLGIKVSYTPNAPAPAVAEFTVGLILDLLRSISLSSSQMHQGQWQRHFGRRIAEVTIGVIGLGRIGVRVLNRLRGFGTPRLLLNDIAPNMELSRNFKVEWVSKEEIYRQADVVCLHLPLTNQTKNMIRREHLEMMKSDAVIINTSRGGIINETDLHDIMAKGHLSGAAIDVFYEEPYSGPLCKIERCVLTAHMGSMSEDCRSQMELEATQEALRFLTEQPLTNSVPNAEFDNQVCDR